MRRADNLIGGQPFQADKGRVVQDTLELVDALQKAADRILVPDLLRNDIPPAEEGKMIQERPFIEMKFEAAVQKAHLVFLRAGLIILFQEPVLPVYYRIIRQYLDCLCSCAVHGCVVFGSNRKQLRQEDLEADGHVCVFGEDASFFHGQDRKLTFQRCGF